MKFEEPGVSNYDTSSAAALTCPIAIDDRFPASSVTDATVMFCNNNTTAPGGYGQICSADDFSLTLACGAYKYFTTSGCAGYIGVDVSTISTYQTQQFYVVIPQAIGSTSHSTYKALITSG